jgi:hypothetical protein
MYTLSSLGVPLNFDGGEKINEKKRSKKEKIGIPHKLP